MKALMVDEAVLVSSLEEDGEKCVCADMDGELR